MNKRESVRRIIQYLRETVQLSEEEEIMTDDVHWSKRAVHS